MKGYKGFTSDFKCRDFQFKVGETYEHKEKIQICQSGFHFCLVALKCLEYYPLYYDKIYSSGVIRSETNTRYAEIEALGEIVTQGDKSVTSKIKIVREIPPEEWLQLCTGENTLYYNNGEKYTISYKNGKKDGLMKYYYPEQPENPVSSGRERLKYSQSWKNGQLDGICERWYSNGTLNSRREWKNGKQNGLAEEWYNSGELKRRENWIDDKLNDLS